MATPGYKIIGPDGRETAPFDSDALLSYARRGYIQPTTSVFDPSVGQWIPASQVNALASLNGGMPPSTPSADQYAYQSYQQYQSPPQKKPFPRAAAIAIGIAVGVIVVFAAFGVGKLASKQKTIASYDGLYAVSVPNLWYKYGTHDPKIIEYISTSDGMLITKLTKMTVSDDQTLDRVTNAVAKVTEEKFNVTSLVSGPVNMKVGGYPARQFELDDDGHIGFHRFRKTIVSTPDGIYDVTVFAGTEDASSSRHEQDAVISSFHRTSVPASRAPSHAAVGDDE